MKVLIQRRRKSGSFGSAAKFIVRVRAELSKEEMDLVEKYNLGDEIIFLQEKTASVPAMIMAEEMGGIISSIIAKRLEMFLSVGEAINGKEFVSKDFLDMIRTIDQLKEGLH